jgi:hypothetical protein
MDIVLKSLALLYLVILRFPVADEELKSLLSSEVMSKSLADDG